jgi:hypothetical protein
MGAILSRFQHLASDITRSRLYDSLFFLCFRDALGITLLYRILYVIDHVSASASSNLQYSCLFLGACMSVMNYGIKASLEFWLD